MSTADVEFSRPVALARLGAEPFRQEIEADRRRTRTPRPPARPGGARPPARGGDPAPPGGATVLLEARFEADFTQTCVVTLEPVPGAVSRIVSRCSTGRPTRRRANSIPMPMPTSRCSSRSAATAIDIGEAVAQELSLALPEFPRHPEAAAEPVDAAAEPIDDRFAALARLGKTARE